MTAPRRAGAPVVDIAGIGFGPSNLALAIALQEHNEKQLTGDGLTSAFYERQQRFGWHRGMLIDGATMQVSFLKDLATMRNPTSEYGFLSYLHSKGRLSDFINHKMLFPTRLEFHDYLEWTAAKFDHLVSYDSEVVEVLPVREQDAIVALDVHVRCDGGTGPTAVQRTRNLVVAAGLEPVPQPVGSPSERIFHSAHLLERVSELDSEPRTVTVIGAGQSAAECTEFLHRRFPAARVYAVFSRYGYSVADDNPFANRIFDPGAVDVHFAAPDEVKRMLFGYHGNTNYAVVDVDLTDELYRRLYQERVRGEERLRVLNAARTLDLQPVGDRVRVSVAFLPTGEVTSFDSDLVVYATGYRPRDPLTFLGDVGRHCRLDDNGRLRLHRDYSLVTDPELRCGIYLQGGTEHTHGISSGLLSNSAIRAGEIVQSVAEGQRSGSVRTHRPAMSEPALSATHDGRGN
ncbi:lysine N(6)-hydroxylase/L-ornithine N(5)-oxygenase family protein [Micromonospora sp. C31]|uniref:lysine N(6)-hydroxylase/L-ornithine N(5)-oxygenase family protein n=1 Tax=Micromonospora sp. C31 TaxID=2824876 RepID=UPI001B370C48|nr:SidA/IucD/PvdA family monooxygenase [Micromonospora sp. C31]MBQ1075630.1 lysine N(6)-hydroxylase/L-ornithine N(5)-oxygenase family protein [Micromonospora sp. C31]